MAHMGRGSDVAHRSAITFKYKAVTTKQIILEGFLIKTLCGFYCLCMKRNSLHQITIGNQIFFF